MKRSFPDDFSIRGQAKRLHPEPLSPVSGRGIAPVTNYPDGDHNTMPGPADSSDAHNDPHYSDGPPSEHFPAHNWPSYRSSLRRRSFNEDTGLDNNRRNGYDSYRPSEASPTTVFSPPDSDHQEDPKPGPSVSDSPHAREAKEDRPRFHGSQTIGSKVLPGLTTDQPDPSLWRRDSELRKESISKSLCSANKSGSSTPRIAMTPLGATVPPDMAEEATPVAKLLHQFSRGILSISAQTNKNESTKKTQYRIKKEIQRFRNKYDDFAPLAEMRQRDLQKVEKKSSRSNKKLQATSREHHAVTQSIASNLALGGVSMPPSRLGEDKSKRDIKTMRGELDRVLSSLDKTRSEHSSMRKDFERIRSESEKSNARLNETEWTYSRLHERYEKIEDRMLSISKQVDKVDDNTAPLSTIRTMQAEATAAANKVNAAKMENMLEQQESLPKRMGELETKIQQQVQQRAEAQVEMNSHGTQLQTLQSDHVTLASKVTEIKTILDQQVLDLGSLNDVVSGEDGKKDGLLDNIASAQEDVKKFWKALTAMNDAMNEYEADVKQANSHVNTIEGMKARLEIRVNKLEDSEVERSNHDPSAEITAIKEELASCSKTVQKFKAEQDEKDDLVAGEVERLDNELIKHADLITRVRDRNASAPPNPSIASLPPSIPEEKRPAAPPDPLTTLPPLVPEEGPSAHDKAEFPYLTNGTSTKKEISDHFVEELENKHKSIKQEVDNLHSSLQDFKSSTLDTTNTHDTFIVSLQQRFDNLTTDDMVQCIIHQMQSLYPQHPGNVWQEIQSMRQHMQQFMGQSAGNQQHFDQKLQMITANFSGLGNLVRTNQQHVTPLIQARCEKVESTLIPRIEIGNRKNQEANERLQSDVTSRLATLSAEEQQMRSKLWEDMSTHIEQRLKVVTEEQQDSISIIKQEVESNLSRIQALQKGLQSLRTEHTTEIKNLSKEVQDTTSKVKHGEISKDQLHSLQRRLDSLNSAHITSINDLEKQINEMTTVLQNQDSETSNLNTSMEKIQDELKGHASYAVHNMTHYYRAISDLNHNNGFGNDMLNCGAERTPPGACQLDQPPRQRSISISLGHPSSPLRPPTSQSIVSKPSTGTSASAGTADAPIFLSQSTDGANEDDESDAQVSAARKKRKRKKTMKAEESPLRKKKSRAPNDEDELWDVPKDRPNDSSTRKKGVKKGRGG